jgi:hypothetical protein
MEPFILETERLKFRPLRLEDGVYLSDLFDADPEVWRFDPG